MSTLLTKICKILNIQKTQTTSYHSQTDGLVERFNRAMGDMLAMAVKNEKNNLAVNESLNETPHYLLFGNDPMEADDISTSYTRKRFTDIEYSDFFSIWRKSIDLARSTFKEAQQK